MTELHRSHGLSGTVSSFDEAVGLGVVTTGQGVEYPFHCIEIVGGARTIEVGAAVTFDPLAKLGRYEAANLRPTST